MASSSFDDDEQSDESLIDIACELFDEFEAVLDEIRAVTLFDQSSREVSRFLYECEVILTFCVLIERELHCIFGLQFSNVSGLARLTSSLTYAHDL